MRAMFIVALLISLSGCTARKFYCTFGEHCYCADRADKDCTGDL